MSSQIPPDHELNRNCVAMPSDGDIGVGHFQDMVLDDIASLIEEPSRQLIQNLALERNGLAEDMIERRNSIGCHQDKAIRRTI